MNKILILTCDIIGAKMAGPAVRVVEIARVLSEKHHVVIGCPYTTEPLPELNENISVEAYGSSPHWEQLNHYDTIMIPGSMKVDAQIEPPVIVDLYDPFILSNLSRSDKSESVQAAELKILKQNLQRGDFFVCASSRQRDFWMGVLASEGRLNVHQFQADSDLKTLIQLAPFGIPAERAHPGDWEFPGDPDAFKLVWAGGIWDWFDPLTLLKAVAELEKIDVKVSLFFMGTQHPNPKMTKMAMVEKTESLATELGLLNRSVFFGDWIPYSKRGAVLAAADAGISTHTPHLETHFSFRTRILDYIWARLPYICTDGDAFGDLAKEKGTGIAVPGENVEALSEAIRLLATDSIRYDKCKENLETLASKMVWSTTLKSLMTFCSKPGYAPDSIRQTTGISVDDAVVTSACETSADAVGEILGDGFRQIIPVKSGGFCRLDLKFATYDRLNSGLVTVELCDAKGREFARFPFDVRTLDDNEWRTFRFGPVPQLPDQLVIIRIVHHDAQPGNAITVWMDPSRDHCQYELDGVTGNGLINHRVYTIEYPESDSRSFNRSHSLFRKFSRWFRK